MILNPRLSPRQFLRTVAAELGVAEPRFHANDLLDQIHERLLALDEAGRAALLIVDEAHLIPGKPTFEEIRLLTNFQLDDRNLIAVVLVGQPELRDAAAQARAYPRADPAHRRRSSTCARSAAADTRGVRAPSPGGGRRPSATCSTTAALRAPAPGLAAACRASSTTSPPSPCSRAWPAACR